jgi:hypothetical protein
MSNGTEVVKAFTHSTAAQDWANSPERKPVFSVTRQDGDNEPVVDTFTMPAKPNPGLALDYLRRARKEGELANSWLIETAVGSDGYDALVEELAGLDGHEGLEVLKSIVERIQRVAMGGLEGKG